MFQVQGREATNGQVQRYLDRLAGLEKIITPQLIEQALRDSGRRNERQCRLCHPVVLWLLLAVGVFTDLPIRSVFKFCRRLRELEKTPSRSALAQAKARLGVEPLQELFRLVVGPLGAPDTPGVFYKGMRRMAIDSTVLDVPDTPANDEAFGRPDGGAERGPGAFPQVRKVSLVELGTHMEVAFVAQPVHVSERAAVPELLQRIPAGSLLYEDRGFFSYGDWKKADAQGIKLLVRVGSHLVLKPIQHLSDGSFLAKIYPSPWARSVDREGIVVRVIRYTLDDPQRTGHAEPHTLMANLLDAAEYPALELIAEYHERWEHELVYDEQKTHQDPRRPTKPTHLRSQTPLGVRQELYALSLAHFGVHAMMLDAAVPAHIDVDRLSFTGCLQILRCRLPECDPRSEGSVRQWYRAVIAEMAQEQIPARRNRVNPRVIKRKMSKWAKARPEHRRQAPLRKSYVESIVMLN